MEPITGIREGIATAGKGHRRQAPCKARAVAVAVKGACLGGWKAHVLGGLKTRAAGGWKAPVLGGWRARAWVEGALAGVDEGADAELQRLGRVAPLRQPAPPPVLGC